MYLKRFNRYNCGCKPSTSAAHVQEHAHARDFMTMSGKVGARSRARKRRRKRRTPKHTPTNTHAPRKRCVRARAWRRSARARRTVARGRRTAARARWTTARARVAGGARAVVSFVVDGDDSQPPVTIAS